MQCPAGPATLAYLLFVMSHGDFLYDAILPLVDHPSRYIDSELNLSNSGFAPEKFNVLLAFPDSYEIGMSHQGIRILYHRLSRMARVGVEFVFAPWPDAERLMHTTSEPLRSQLTLTSARRFDVLGFSLTYELHYTNMLMMLELAGIPLEARNRSEGDPIIIAGGPACSNPLPFINAVDAVFVGDAEESLPEAVEALIELRESGARREKKLEALSQIDGVYVEGLNESVRSRVYLFKDGDLPDRPIAPASQIVHNRLSIEVMRGCTRGCRFCHAGMFYRPRRERSIAEITRAIIKGVEATGWPEVSLLSLSTSDYSRLEEVVAAVTPWLEAKRVSLAMPSLRPETITAQLVAASAMVRRSGFTLAPEAGTERLRRVINKWMSDEEIVAGCRKILDAGWQNLKLYFMIGLPTETEEDLEGIASLVQRILDLPRPSKRFKLAVTISPFVPKPHTPFQWERQSTIGEIREKESYLASRLRSRSIHLSLRDPRFSVLEGIFSRGGREMWNVLLSAYRLGCRFDGWSGMMRFDLWESALEEYGYTVDSLLRERDPDRALPWDFIDVGVSRRFLLLERKKAYEESTTPDCRVSRCTGCDACGGEAAGERAGMPLDGIDEPYRGTAYVSTEQISPGRSDSQKEDPLSGSPGSEEPGKADTQYLRYRIIYERSGRARFLSHQETLDVLRRALRMSALPLHYTEGFNPHPKISAGPPLPVGMEGLREYIDVEFAREAKPEKDSLNELLPDGLKVKEVAGPFSRKRGKLPAEFVQNYLLTFQALDAVAEEVAGLLDDKPVPALRWLRLAESLGVIGGSERTKEEFERMRSELQVSSSRETMDEQKSKEQAARLFAYRLLLNEVARALADEVLAKFFPEEMIDAASFFGALIRLASSRGERVVGRKGREKDIGLCSVERVIPHESIELSISSGADAPTPRELLSKFLKQELVPLVRIVRVSTLYRTDEGLVDLARLV